MRSKETIAQGIIAALNGYKAGDSYESLVDVMRDLAVEQIERFRFADGSSISIEQSKRSANCKKFNRAEIRWAKQ